MGSLLALRSKMICSKTSGKSVTKPNSEAVVPVCCSKSCSTKQERGPRGREDNKVYTIFKYLLSKDTLAMKQIHKKFHSPHFP